MWEYKRDKIIYQFSVLLLRNGLILELCKELLQESAVLLYQHTHVHTHTFITHNENLSR